MAFSLYFDKAGCENLCTRKIIHHHSHRLLLRETGKEETLHPSCSNKSTLEFVSVSGDVQLNEKYIIVIYYMVQIHQLSELIHHYHFLICHGVKNLYQLFQHHQIPLCKLKVLPFCAVRLRNLLPKQFLNMTVTNEMQEQ
jgi:hypothetical protein